MHVRTLRGTVVRLLSVPAAAVLCMAVLTSACGGGQSKRAQVPLAMVTPADGTNPGANSSTPPNGNANATPTEGAPPPSATPTSSTTPAPASPANPAPAPAPSAPPPPPPAPDPPAADTAPSSVLPRPPDDATVFRHLEEKGGWNLCTGCAGGDNNAGEFWTNGGVDWPSLDGASREFFVGWKPWAAALFYKPLSEWPGQYSWATHFLWDFWVYVDSDSMHNVWDLEFDLYQAKDGYEYMIGTHCVFGSTWDGRNWEVYSQADHEWKGTDIPCSRDRMHPGEWNHVQWMLRRVPDSTKYVYQTLIVNGDVYDVGIPQWAAPSDWQDTLGVQYQIDTGPGGGGVHEWLDKATLTIW